jgi:hypothetical protein
MASLHLRIGSSDAQEQVSAHGARVTAVQPQQRVVMPTETRPPSRPEQLTEGGVSVRSRLRT